MLLRGFFDAGGLVAPPLAQRLPPDPLCDPHRLFARRIQPSRGCVGGVGAERLHHVFERDGHVSLDVRVGEIPAARAGDYLKYPPPAPTPREMHHAPEQAPVGPPAEPWGR